MVHRLIISEAIEAHEAVYQEFEERAAPFKRHAVCREGCADCCTEVGMVGATTLEGLIIRGFLKGLPKTRADTIRRRLKENRKEKLTKAFAPCAFLDEHQSCMIYPVRPFSCRRLYSVEKCGEKGPVIHREAYAMALDAENSVKALDPHGCSAHLSYILHLLDRDGFRRAYLKGTWNPEKYAEWIRKYDLQVHSLRPLEHS